MTRRYRLIIRTGRENPMRPGRRPPAMLAMVALAADALTAETQDPAALGPPQQQPAFRGRIDFVSVDALVTDKHGQPVTGLKVNDFEVKERGKPQSIETFKFVQGEAPLENSSTLDAIISTDDVTREATKDGVGLIVIFLDDYHVQRSNSVKMRERLARFVEGISPRDLVAIIYPLTPVTSLTFSRDRERQVREIQTFLGRKYLYFAMNSYEENYMCAGAAEKEGIRARVTYGALETLGAYLGTFTERRKTVLFVSEGPTTGLPKELKNDTVGCRVPLPTSSKPGVLVDAITPRALPAAITHNVALYTLDPRGLAWDDFDMRDTPDEMRASHALVVKPQDALRTMASATGGRAIVNLNEYDDELAQITRDMSAYYLLGYTSRDAKHDGQFHEISVHVNRADIEVRARPGYWAFDDNLVKRAPTPSPKAPAAVAEALATLEPPAPEAVIRSSTAATRGPDGRTRVTLVWEELTAPSERGHVDRVHLTATPSDGPAYFDDDVRADGGSGAAGGSVTFAVAPGRLRVRTTALDTRGRELDSDSRELMAPDFTGTETAISTPLVFRATTLGQMRQIRAAGAPRPTVTREFTRSDRLLIRFETFGPGGTAPLATIRFLTRLGQPLADLPAPLARSGRGFEAEIGLSSLTVGEYLIEIRSPGQPDDVVALVPVRIVP
jgi:VWFA-related protein